MQDSQELIERIKLGSKPLSKSHRRIAQYIASHYDKAVYMTAVALGRACGVSESTVVRFAMARGYEGYPELREALASVVRQRLTSEQRFELTQGLEQSDVLAAVLKNDARNIRKTMEGISQQDFEEAAQRLLSARRVYLMGLRSAAPLAQFMYHYLHQILSDVLLVHNTTGDVFEEIARIGRSDVLVGISFPRYSARTLECMRFARGRGAQVVGLTDGDMSPLREVSDVCLCADTNMASFVDSLAAPMSVINALVVSVGLRRHDELAEHFRQLEEIWNAHSVYLNRPDA